MTDENTPPKLSLKERLKQQADAAKAEEARRHAADIEGERFYQAELRSVMLQAAAYFREIVADLDTIGMTTTTTFPIGPSGEIDVKFIQGEYSVYVDDNDNPRQIGISCVCELPNEVTRLVPTAKEGDDFERYLKQMGIHYYRRRQFDAVDLQGERSRFVMEGAVNAGLSIVANVEDKAIDVRTRNLESLPIKSYRLNPKRLDEDLFEAMASLLIRESDTLMKSEVDPQVREQLQRENEKRKQEIERQIAQAKAEEDAERQNRLDQRLLSRLKDVATSAAKRALKGSAEN